MVRIDARTTRFDAFYLICLQVKDSPNIPGGTWCDHTCATEKYPSIYQSLSQQHDAQQPNAEYERLIQNWNPLSQYQNGPIQKL